MGYFFHKLILGLLRNKIGKRVYKEFYKGVKNSLTPFINYYYSYKNYFVIFS